MRKSYHKSQIKGLKRGIQLARKLCKSFGHTPDGLNDLSLIPFQNLIANALKFGSFKELVLDSNKQECITYTDSENIESEYWKEIRVSIKKALSLNDFSSEMLLLAIDSIQWYPVKESSFSDLENLFSEIKEVADSLGYTLLKTRSFEKKHEFRFVSSMMDWRAFYPIFKSVAKKHNLPWVEVNDGCFFIGEFAMFYDLDEAEFVLLNNCYHANRSLVPSLCPVDISFLNEDYENNHRGDIVIVYRDYKGYSKTKIYSELEQMLKDEFRISKQTTELALYKSIQEVKALDARA